MKKYSRSYQKLFRAALASSVAGGAIVAASPTFVQANDSGPALFNDLNPNAHYFEPVMNLSARGIVQGYEDSTYKPNNSVTRGQAAKILALSLGLDTVNVKNPGFVDVKETDSYYGSIAALVQAGIINGYEDKTFKPNSKLKRSQMAKIIALGFGLEQEALTDTRFSDVKSNDTYAGYVQALLSNNITTGTTPTTFGPNAHVTRGQIASFIVRSEMSVSQNGISSQIVNITDEAIELTDGLYQLQTEMKTIFNPSNLSALKGAKITVNVQDDHVERISSLEITASGTASNHVTLDGNNAALKGNLVINGDYASIKNIVIEGDLEVGNGVNNSFQSEAITVKGKTIVSDNSSAKEKLAEGMRKVYNIASVQSFNVSADSKTVKNKPTIIFSNSTMGAIEVSKKDVTIESKGSTKVQSFVLYSNVHLKADAGVVIPNVVLSEGARTVTIDAPVTNLKINSKSSLTIEGTGDIGEIKVDSNNAVKLETKGKIANIVISSPTAKVSFGSDAKIGNLVLPEGIEAGSVIQDYDKVKGNIEKIGGEINPEAKPESPVSNNVGGSGGGNSGGGGITNPVVPVDPKPVDPDPVDPENPNQSLSKIVSNTELGLTAATAITSSADVATVEVTTGDGVVITAVAGGDAIITVMNADGNKAYIDVQVTEEDGVLNITIKVTAYKEPPKPEPTETEREAAKQALAAKIADEVKGTTGIKEVSLEFANKETTVTILDPEASIASLSGTGTLVALAKFEEVRGYTIGDVKRSFYKEDGAREDQATIKGWIIEDALKALGFENPEQELILGSVINKEFEVEVIGLDKKIDFTDTYTFSFVKKPITDTDREAAKEALAAKIADEVKGTTGITEVSLEFANKETTVTILDPEASIASLSGTGTLVALAKFEEVRGYTIGDVKRSFYKEDGAREDQATIKGWIIEDALKALGFDNPEQELVLGSLINKEFEVEVIGLDKKIDFTDTYTFSFAKKPITETEREAAKQALAAKIADEVKGTTGIKEVSLEFANKETTVTILDPEASIASLSGTGTLVALAKFEEVRGYTIGDVKRSFYKEDGAREDQATIKGWIIEDALKALGFENPDQELILGSVINKEFEVEVIGLDKKIDFTDTYTFSFVKKPITDTDREAAKEALAAKIADEVKGTTGITEVSLEFANKETTVTILDPEASIASLSGTGTLVALAKFEEVRGYTIGDVKRSFYKEDGAREDQATIKGWIIEDALKALGFENPDQELILVSLEDKQFKVEVNGQSGEVDFTDTYKFIFVKNPIAIASIEQLEEITVGVGETVELPYTVTATMSDGTIRDLNVEWESTTIDTTEVGKREVTGKIEGTDLTVTLSITVEVVPDIVSLLDDLTKAKEISSTRIRPEYTNSIDEWNGYWGEFEIAKSDIEQIIVNLQDKGSVTLAESKLIINSMKKINETLEVLDGLEDFDSAFGERIFPKGFEITINDQSRTETGGNRLRSDYDEENSTITLLLSKVLQGQGYLTGTSGLGIKTGLLNVMKSMDAYKVISSGKSIELYNENGVRKTDKALENEGSNLALAWVGSIFGRYSNMVGGIHEFIMFGRTTSGVEFQRTYTFKFVDAGVNLFAP